MFFPNYQVSGAEPLELGPRYPAHQESAFQFTERVISSGVRYYNLLDG